MKLQVLSSAVPMNSSATTPCANCTRGSVTAKTIVGIIPMKTQICAVGFQLSLEAFPLKAVDAYFKRHYISIFPVGNISLSL